MSDDKKIGSDVVKMTKSNEHWVFYMVQPKVLTSIVTIIDTLRVQFSRVTVCKST